MLDRLRRNEEDDIAVPVFDRDLEISRAVARMIPRAVRTLIVDGNYCFWTSSLGLACAPLDITVFVGAPEEILL